MTLWPRSDTILSIRYCRVKLFLANSSSSDSRASDQRDTVSHQPFFYPYLFIYRRGALLTWTEWYGAFSITIIDFFLRRTKDDLFSVPHSSFSRRLTYFCHLDHSLKDIIKRRNRYLSLFFVDKVLPRVVQDSTRLTDHGFTPSRPPSLILGHFQNYRFRLPDMPHWVQNRYSRR